MIKKLLFFLIFFLNNISAMLNIEGLNKKDSHLTIKHEDLKFTKSLLDLLPRELWLEILSFLDYKENKQEFINFWGPNIGLDDLNLKKMVIDIHRSIILNSKNLKSWKKLTNNIGKSWKRKESRDSLKDYLEILNKEFKDDLNLISSKFADKKNFDSFIICQIWELSKNYDFIHGEIGYIALSDKSDEILSQKLKLVLSVLNIKKILLMYDSKQPFVVKWNFKRNYWRSLGIFTIWASFIVLVCVFTSIFKDLVWYAIPIIIIWFFAPIIVLILAKIQQTKFNSFAATDSYIIDLKNIYSEIFKKYLKANIIDIFDSDNYFLELLGHKFEQDCDILEFEDIDLKGNGKEEVSFQEDPAII